MRNRHLTAITGALLSLSLLAACGGGGSGGGDAPPDADVVVRSVTGNRFDRAEYTATAGDVKIALLGEPASNHTLLVTTEDGTQIGAKLKVAPSKDADGDYQLEAGTFNLLCDVPGHTEMRAKLIVS